MKHWLIMLWLIVCLTSCTCNFSQSPTAPKHNETSTMINANPPSGAATPKPNDLNAEAVAESNKFWKAHTYGCVEILALQKVWRITTTPSRGCVWA